MTRICPARRIGETSWERHCNMHIGLDPNLLKFGGFVVSWHGLMTFVAVVVGVVLVARWSRRAGVLPDVVFSTAVWAIVGGIVLARVVHVIDRWDFYRDNLSQIPAIWNGGIAIFGALLGGLLGGWLFVRIQTSLQQRRMKRVYAKYAAPAETREESGYIYLRFHGNQEPNLEALSRELGGEVAADAEGRKRVRLMSYNFGVLADLAAPATALAMAVGRIGDVLNGEHVGKPTSMLWGVVYTHPDSISSQTYGMLSTHPIGAYELLLALAVFGVIWFMRDRLRPSGMLFVGLLVLYSLGRFFLSFMRVDKDWLAGLDQAQLISLVVLAVTVPFLAYRAQFVRRPAAAKAKPPVANKEKPARA